MKEGRLPEDEFLVQVPRRPLLPDPVREGPLRHHASRRGDKRNTGAARHPSGHGVAGQPCAAVVDHVGPHGLDDGPQAPIKVQRAPERPLQARSLLDAVNVHVALRKNRFLIGRRICGDGRDQMHLDALRIQRFTERRHAARGAAVVGAGAGQDVENSYTYLNCLAIDRAALIVPSTLLPTV